jgi:hypothetical protein
MIESTMLTATTTTPIVRGTTVWSWMPNGEMPTKSNNPRRSHMTQASIERRPSSAQIHIPHVEAQRELVQDERTAGAEEHGEHVAAGVTDPEREVDHARCQHEYDTDDHVVDVNAADATGRPGVASRKPRVEPRERERRKRRGQQPEQRVTVGQVIPVDLDRMGELVPQMVEMQEMQIKEQTSTSRARNPYPRPTTLGRSPPAWC